ncbi:hypothetical protein K2P97_10435 [bacterium]|nr:hypothetical protein [bacterium]
MGNTKNKPELKPQLQTEERHSVSTLKINDRTSGGAYTEIPKFDEGSKQPGYNPYLKSLLLALLIAGSGYGAYKYFSKTQSDIRTPSSVTATQEKRATLTVSPEDLDLKTTAEVKKDLLAGKKVDLIQIRSATSYDVDPSAQSGAQQDIKKQNQLVQQQKVNDQLKDQQQSDQQSVPEVQAQQPSQAERLPASPEPTQIIEKIKSGDMEYYSFQIFDSAWEDGDVVEISIDGQPIGYVDMSNTGLTISVPLEPGKSHTMTVRGVRDGGGGITFGAQLMNSNIMLDWFAAGEIRNIDLRFTK